MFNQEDFDRHLHHWALNCQRVIGERLQSAGSPATPPTSSKRPRIDQGITNAEATVHYSGILDMDSDDTREEFKCPICFELFLGEIYQCSGGHSICKECLLKSKRLKCAQCQASLKGKDNQWIRSRNLEQILDSYWIKCSFHKNGCPKALSRGEIQKHMEEECVFNGKCIQICQFSTRQPLCQYWTRVTQPQEVINHFVTFHEGSIKSSDAGIMNGLEICLEQTPQNIFYQNRPIFLKKGNNYYLIASCFTADNTFCVGCIQINQPLPNENKMWDVVLLIKCQSLEINTDIMMQLPVVQVLDSLPVLLDPPICIRRGFLEKHYVNTKKSFTICFQFRDTI